MVSICILLEDMIERDWKKEKRNESHLHVFLHVQAHLSCTPCNKCDIDSHGNYGNSMSFHVTNQRQCGRNPHQIPWLFHVIYPGLFVFHAKTWYGFWTSSIHGISMAFAKKMMGFPSDLVSFVQGNVHVVCVQGIQSLKPDCYEK